LRADLRGINKDVSADEAQEMPDASPKGGAVGFHARLLDAVAEAVIATDLEGRILFWNRWAEGLYGWTAEEVLGQDILAVTPNLASRDQAREIMERLQRGESWSGEFLVQRRDGTTFPAVVKNSPIQDEHGALVGIVGLSWDISDRKQAEAAVAESEEQFRSLVEQSPLSVQILSPDGWTLQVNRAWERLWGTTLSALQAARYNLLEDQQLVAKGIMPFVQRAFAGEAVTIPPIEYDRAETLPELVTDDQPKRWLRAFLYPVKSPAGQIQKVVLVHEDYTERQVLEDALHQRATELVEADRRKDEFLAMLAHELRNPLAPILHALQVLGLRQRDDAGSERARIVLQRQVQHMARLVDDLLDVARLTRGQFELRKESTDLQAVVSQAALMVSPLVDERGQELSISLPIQPVHLEADPARLEQVIVNLLRNATKYTGPGGRIWVTVEPQGEQVVVRVRDTGIGIAADVLPRVFDLFSQADRSLDRTQGGLGIGLTLVRQIIELHGGNVEAHSEGPGKGSEFVVRLPAPAKARPARKQRFDGPQPEAGCGRRVMVVEDNYDTAEMLADILGLWGHEVRAAHDGPAALLLAATFRPDAILLDIGLPGMDGYEVGARLRGLPGLNDTVIVALTGYGQEQDRARSQASGFDMHLTKPVDPNGIHRFLVGLPQRTPPPAAADGRKATTG
jgi:PAS domain S-box-containing protein